MENTQIVSVDTNNIEVKVTKTDVMKGKDFVGKLLAQKKTNLRRIEKANDDIERMTTENTSIDAQIEQIKIVQPTAVEDSAVDVPTP